MAESKQNDYTIQASEYSKIVQKEVAPDQMLHGIATATDLQGETRRTKPRILARSTVTKKTEDNATLQKQPCKAFLGGNFQATVTTPVTQNAEETMIPSQPDLIFTTEESKQKLTKQIEMKFSRKVLIHKLNSNKLVVNAAVIHEQSADFLKELPTEIDIGNLISKGRAWECISEAKKYPTRYEVLVLRLIAANNEDQDSYVKFYEYLSVKLLAGVNFSPENIENLYVLPVLSQNEIPPVLQATICNELDGIGSSALLGVIVKDRGIKEHDVAVGVSATIRKEDAKSPESSIVEETNKIRCESQDDVVKNTKFQKKKREQLNKHIEEPDPSVKEKMQQDLVDFRSEEYKENEHSPEVIKFFFFTLFNNFIRQC